MWLTEAQKIGVGLVTFGIFFVFMGIILFLDAGLIAIGNILFVAGGILILSPQRALEFISKPAKWRGSVCFIVGLIMVFFKWTLFGLVVELVGFINLFGDFFPLIVRFLKSIPYVGNVLRIPFIARILDSIAGVQSPA